jgi:hypothetical protein
MVTSGIIKSMPYIISADELKKALPGYTPDKAEIFHRESAKLADKQYEQAMKRSEPLVILIAGGAASGKSEYVSVYLQNENAIIVDGTLPTLAGAKIKIKKAIKAQKRVAVHCVLPENFLVAYVAFLNRDRKFGDEHFFRTHSATRATVLAIARQFPDISITIIVSSIHYEKGNANMSFRELSLSGHSALVEFLRKEQYSEGNIKEAVFKDYDV